MRDPWTILAGGASAVAAVVALVAAELGYPVIALIAWAVVVVTAMGALLLAGW
jgi:hypothetical protein